MIADSSTVGFLLLDGLNILGVSTELSDPGLERHTVDRTYLGSSQQRKLLTGVSSCEIEQSGDFDDAVGSIHDALTGSHQDRVLSWCAAGNTIGKHFVGAVVDRISYKQTLQADDFVQASAAYGCSAHDDGLIIAHLVSRGAAGDTTANRVDNGAQSSGGGAGYLQVTGLTLGGYTGLSVKIRHSPDGSTWADLITFTNVSAVGAERRMTAVDPIGRYLSVSWSWAGSGSSQSATFAVGFARNQ